jgi:MFS family permease
MQQTTETEIPKSHRGNSVFVRLLTAYFISSVGDWLYKLALPLLVFELTGSAVQMAGTFALTFLPYIVMSLFGGVIADRYPRNKVLIVCDVSGALFLALIAYFGGYLGSMAGVYIFVFLASSVTPVHHPSFQAFIPEVVDDADLPKANALVSGSENIISIAAPLLTGVIVALIGPINTILLNAASFLVSALLVASIKAEKQPENPVAKQKIKDTIVEGFQYVWSHPVLKYGAIMFVFSNFAINIFQANLVFYLADMLGASAQTIGIVFALTGIGAVIGAVVAPWVMARFESGHIIVTSTILAGVFSFPLLIVDDPILVGAVWSFETFFSTINAITYFTLRQRSVPKHMLGRAVSITRLIAFSSIPVAAMVGGLLLEYTNIAVIIIICGTVRMFAGIFAAFSPLASYKALSVEE